MGNSYWNGEHFIPHYVRNMLRRGWLEKTYNDKKMLRGRVKTGERIENDELDILHPVGMVSHVKASEKTEIVTMDIGGDPSRRVIAWVLGDREYHPKPDENEKFVYAPGDKKIYERWKKKPDEGQQGGQGQQGGGGQSGGNAQTVDYGREPGTHREGSDQRITDNTAGSYGNAATKGMGFTTQEGSHTINAGQNTQFQAGKHIRKGETHRDSPMYVNGIVHANDHYAGGGTTISGQPRMTRMTRSAGQSDDHEAERPQEDGTQAWNAQGQGGHTSLLKTAAKVGTMGGGGMMGNLTGMMGLLSKMMQGGGSEQQQQQDREELARKVAELEQQLAQLRAQEAEVVTPP